MDPTWEPPKKMTQAEERAQQLKGLNRSVHTQQIEDVYEVPMEDIIRPLQSELDEEKVLRMMELVKVMPLSDLT